MISQYQLQNESTKRNRIFNPQKYISQYYSEPQNTETPHLDPLNMFMAKAFSVLPECQHGIQIGCGPVLTLAGFSTRKIRNLLMTEYNTECFKHILNYIEDNEYEKAQWKSTFSMISKLEGNNENVEERVKRSIEGCIKIDLTTPRIFQYPYFKKVDVITSSLCIEAVATSRSNYSQIISNLKRYLKPKGYIYLIGVLQETFYMVGDQKLPCFEVTQQLLQWAMAQNEFNIILLETEIFENPPTEQYDLKGFFSLIAQLKK